MDIFGYFFHPEIMNWYCDDWITRIYEPYFSEIQVDMECVNTILGDRYTIIDCPQLNNYISDGIRNIHEKTTAFSYCVFGSDPKYCFGIVKNLEQIQILYPNRQVWIHCGNDVPNKYIEKYKTFPNVHIVQYPYTGGRLMTVRFFTIDFPCVQTMICRDADSRFEKRDIWCISHFMADTNKKVFTIRDHPWHGAPVMGGLWGMKKISGLELTSIQDELFDVYQSDQYFLDKYIYSQYKHLFTTYTDYQYITMENPIRIGVPRETSWDFCGNVVLFDKDMSEYYQFSTSF
jgi:hypothetical protein